MKNLELFEVFSKNNKGFKKSDFTFQERAPSKIDPSKKVIIKSWMICPECSTDMKDISHGETRQCQKCNKKMTVFGNLLTVKSGTYAPSYSEPKEKHDVRYTSTNTMEHLQRDQYVRGNQMTCPLCKAILNAIDHGGKIICYECGLKMENWGNDLKCSIDNDKLELFDTKQFF